MSLPNSPNDQRIFAWLGMDSKGTPYHLHPLNLVWSRDGVEHDLAVYRQVSERLKAEPTYWSALLRAANWRHTLVGCTCLLVSNQGNFVEDLRFRFESGSMVVPQIAVTLGLLHPTDARGFFESILSRQSLFKDPRKVVSAHRTLMRMGTRPSRDIFADMWTGIERDDASVSEQIVQKHWDFWSPRVRPV